jgi:endonuclease/exonuclease/phosphatase family metal-dependent hydrolase
MKMTLLKLGLFLAIAGSLICACAEKTEPENQGDGTVDKLVLSASLPDTQTKTSLSDTYDVLWTTGDKISVNGTLSNAVAAADNGKDNVTFTVSGSLTAPFKVLYPGTTSTNVITLPATQNYVANSFDSAAAASYGTATKNSDNTYSASLTSFCGLVRLALKGSATLDRIEINSLGSEKLYGSFTLATNSTGFTGAFSGGTAGTLTYSFGSGITLSGSDTYIYIALPAQTYASGIEALVYQADGAFMRLKFWGSGNTLGNTDLIAFDSKTFAAGRTENLFEIDGLVVEDGGEPTAEAPGITVGVYNIKMDENRTGTNNTYINMDRSDVQAGLGSTIAGMGADIFGINEIGEDNMPGKEHDIKAWAIAQGLSSSDYTWMMDYPNKVSRSGVLSYSYSAEMYYANVFAYNKNTITVEDEGYVWLCNDEDDYWSSMKNAYEHSTGRHTAVYAKCKHKVSGKRFWFIVTHFDTYYGNDDGDNLHNVKSFKIFAQHLKNDVEDLPIIAVGDFNFGSKEEDKTTDCPNNLELTSYWTDVYDTMYAAHSAAGDLSSWYYKTYNGTQSGSQHNYYYPFITFTKNHPDRRLDHIVYKNSASHTVTPISYKTVRRTYVAEDDNTWCPSDHLAIVSYITFD